MGLDQSSPTPSCAPCEQRIRTNSRVLGRSRPPEKGVLGGRMKVSGTVPSIGNLYQPLLIAPLVVKCFCFKQGEKEGCALRRRKEEQTVIVVGE